ncbi:MAG TPA: hypothetical protein VGJ15_11110 [Pirellulales bacterium]|jgi:hypothetical protein
MYNQSDLAAYLDEALPVETMAAIEDALRHDAQLMAKLTEIISRRDAGVHSVGDIWRRHQLSCITRQQMGSHLLGILPDEESAYIQFHIEVIGCRWCQANLDDLQAEHAQAHQQAAVENATKRRRKYFQSSAGHLQTAKR